MYGMQNIIKLDLEDHINNVDTCIIATGMYNRYEPIRVVYKTYRDHSDDEIRIEVKEVDNCFGEEAWLTIPKYTNHFRSSALEMNHKDVFLLRQNIYKTLLHELLKIYYGELKYPFEIYQKNSWRACYIGAWRIICVGPDLFKWDDVVENNMGEKMFVARDNSNGAETTNIEDACLYFFKKIAAQTRKKKIDTSA